jgi:hypothetical protein
MAVVGRNPGMLVADLFSILTGDTKKDFPSRSCSAADGNISKPLDQRLNIADIGFHLVNGK